MTSNLPQRISGHKHLRPELYHRGMKVEILSRHRSIDRAATEEARQIFLRKTLTPHGNNKHRGGLSGRLRKLCKSKSSLAQAKDMIQEAKDAIALSRMQKNHKPLSHRAEWKRRWRTWQRHDQGLPPLRGTEHFLAEERYPPRKKPQQKTHDKRAATMKAKFARWREEGKSMPRPPAGTRGAFTDEQKYKLASTRVRSGIVQGLFYDYRQILKCSAKAKKRHALGLKTIPGTECFVRLQTAPKWKSGATYGQRAEYQRIMIKRVNAWLRQYGIDQGWIKP